MPSSVSLLRSSGYLNTVSLFPGVGSGLTFNSVSANGTSATVRFSYSDPSYVVTFTGSNLQTIAGGTDISGTITGISVALAGAPSVPVATWSSGTGVTISSLLNSTDKTFLSGGDTIVGGAASEEIYTGVGGNALISGGLGNDRYIFNAGHNFAGDQISDSTAGGE